MFLYSYTLWHRVNSEGPWIVEKHFDKVTPNQSTMPFSEVPFDESIKDIAKQTFADNIKVELWNNDFSEN